MTSAQSRACELKESEKQVREVNQREMDLRSMQDDRFSLKDALSAEVPAIYVSFRAVRQDNARMDGITGQS